MTLGYTGRGDGGRDPIEPNDPMAPANRRISIVLLSQSKADNPDQQPTDETKIATETSLPKVKLEKETAEKNNKTSGQLVFKRQVVIFDTNLLSLTFLNFLCKKKIALCLMLR